MEFVLERMGNILGKGKMPISHLSVVPKYCYVFKTLPKGHLNLGKQLLNKPSHMYSINTRIQKRRKKNDGF